MSPGSQSPIRIGAQFDHGKLQFLRSRPYGFLVVGPEPRGLGQCGAARRAVDKDRGQGFGFAFGWVGVTMDNELLESKGPRTGFRC